MGRNRSKPFGAVLMRVMAAMGVEPHSAPAGTELSRLAAALGKPEGTVRNWDKRETVPRRELDAIALRTGRPVEWFTTGQYEERVGPASSPRALLSPVGLLPTPRTFEIDDGGEHRNFQLIPRYSTRVSAGRGAGSDEGEELGEFALEVNWMRRNLGRSGLGFVSVEVRGDSMQPTLLNGDEIIIDKHVNRVDVSGIYVIGLRGDLLVKRVQRKLDGSLIVKSDNAAYEPEVVSAENAEGFRVVGRLVWPRVR